MRMILQPAYLKKGDYVGIVAPARSVEIQKIELAEEIFKGWGLHSKRGEHLTGKHFQYSGTREERLADLQKMLDDPDIKAVVCAGGGYGSVQLISLLNLNKFVKNPKWLTGYSDVTVLHSLLQVKTGISTIHSTMPVKFDTSSDAAVSVDSLRSALFGELMEYTVKTGKQSISGAATGTLIGGNLSILYSLLGTPFDPDYKGKILFLEEVDEYLYHIDRMIYSLKLSGKLDHLKGLVIGSFSKVHDNETPFGKDYKEIILDAVREFKYPVLFDFTAGHDELNKALYLGREIELTITAEGSAIRFKAE